MIESLHVNPVWGVLITLGVYCLAERIYRKFSLLLLNPVLVSLLVIIGGLQVFGISFERYNEGAQLISLFLTPTVLCLAIPLYRNRSLLKQYWLPILIVIFSSSLSGMTSIIVLAKILALGPELTASILPKSVTTPIAIDVAKQLNGNTALTVLTVIVTGLIGAICGPFFLKIFRIKEHIAKGIAMGTTAHALGTARAFEWGEEEGAMSSLAMTVSALITAMIAPSFFSLFGV